MKKIVITGGSGQIGYILSFLIAKGELFDPLSLYLLVKPENLSKARGIQMELEDCSFPALQSMHCTSDPETAFAKADLVFFAGGRDWDFLSLHGQALNRVAHSKTIVIMIANPCNTNAYVLHKNAPNILPTRIHALVKLDEMRARQFSGKHILVWGNHSPTIVPDGKIELIEFVQRRGAEVTRMRAGISSGVSAAWAAITAAKDLFNKGKLFCSGVYSRGNPYGIDEDLFFSFPCRSLGNGDYRIAAELRPSKAIEELIRKTERELIAERQDFWIRNTG